MRPPSARLPARTAALVGLAALAALAGGLSGCVPYAVGTTPATVAPREVEPSVFLQAVSSRRDLDADDHPKGAGLTFGNTARLGLDESSDIGVQLIGLGGLTATYKRRLAGDGGDGGAAILVGGGIIGTTHLHTEVTLVVSPGALPGAPLVVPYGGVRFQDLTPFTDGLATPPAIGLFFGGRFGWPDLAFSPELGVFYSPSPLVGDDDLIVVPSVTVRGERLRKALGL